MGVEYGWIFSTGAERERLLGVFRECCENAVALGCGMMMSAIGPGAAPTDEAVANIRRAGEIAGSFGLEAHARIPVPASGGAQPRHPARADCARRLEQCRPAARRLSPAARRPARGGASRTCPARRSSTSSSATCPTHRRRACRRSIACRRARVSSTGPGCSGLLAEKGYDGWLSYEAPNPAHWQQPAAETAKQGAEAARRALAKAFP